MDRGNTKQVILDALVKYLIRSGVLAGDDPEIMAAQLCLPISTWINLCDWEPARKPEVMEKSMVSNLPLRVVRFLLISINKFGRF